MPIPIAMLHLLVTLSVIVAQSEDDLIKGADRICAVKVLSLAPPASGSKIVRASVQPIDCFKGEAKENFLVGWPDSTPMIPGAPSLEVNQAAILFLSLDPSKEFYGIESWSQGVIYLQWDE